MPCLILVLSFQFTLALRLYGGTFGVASVETPEPQTRVSTGVWSLEFGAIFFECIKSVLVCASFLQELFLEVSPERSTIDLMNVTSGQSELSLSGCRDQDKGAICDAYDSEWAISLLKIIKNYQDSSHKTPKYFWQTEHNWVIDQLKSLLLN